VSPATDGLEVKALGGDDEPHAVNVDELAEVREQVEGERPARSSLKTRRASSWPRRAARRMRWKPGRSF
jgi:hypothetical protein